MNIDRERTKASARGLCERGRFSEAVALYQGLLDADPNDMQTALKIGEAQVKLGAIPEAIQIYERIGDHYRQQGFSRKAIAVYLQIRHLESSLPAPDRDRSMRVRQILAELFERCGLLADAVPMYDELAVSLLMDGNIGEAVLVFRKMVRIEPSSPMVRLRLAEALAKSGDLAVALQEYLAAAEQLVLEDRRDDAIKVLERALSFEKDPGVAKRAARLYLERAGNDDSMKALSKLQIPFQADARDIETLLLLGQTFRAVGQPDRADEIQKDIARLIRESGDDSRFRRVIADLIREAPDDQSIQRLYR